jgi:hypothetical protein
MPAAAPISILHARSVAQFARDLDQILRRAREARRAEEALRGPDADPEEAAAIEAAVRRTLEAWGVAR